MLGPRSDFFGNFVSVIARYFTGEMSLPSPNQRVKALKGI